MLGIQWEIVSYGLTFSVPWPASLGELPALWMIIGGFTLIYSQVQIFATCRVGAFREINKSYPWWIYLISLFVCVFIWPWTMYCITKSWRKNVRLNKRRHQKWGDDL